MPMRGLRLPKLLNETHYVRHFLLAKKFNTCACAFSGCRLLLSSHQEIFSRRRQVETYYFIRGVEVEYPPHQRTNKRRSLSGTSVQMEKDILAEESEPRDQIVPDVQLTPIESTIKTLLLDVADEIRQKTAVKDGEQAVSRVELELRFTGGWVRDKLLGIGSHDIDVAISTMTGFQFGTALKEYLDNPENLEKYKRNLAGDEVKDAIISLHKIEANPEKSKHLETVTTKIFGLDIDLVNLRKETYCEESRTPQMEFGTAEEDALRRDATINALFYNLNHSVVEDLTGKGLSDLNNKLIRTPLEPYQTFKDDPLRVLRLIRFASRLGYRIDEETQQAMQDDDIKNALRLKISRERVGTEVEKMLWGPDPRGALEFIDKLRLFSTVFSNHQDQTEADTSPWSLAYNALHRLLTSSVNDTDDLLLAMDRVRSVLVRDSSDAYYAWIVVALSPWANVSKPETQKKKPSAPYISRVARDSLRSDNKTSSILSDAASSFHMIAAVKTSFLTGNLRGSDAEIRQQVACNIRSWKKDWRVCVIMSIAQEVMSGTEFSKVIHEYDRFLSYVKEQDLLDVCALRPIVKGSEVMTALGAVQGPWINKAMNMIIQWQLLNPHNLEKEAALEEITRRKAELEYTIKS